MTFVVVSVIFSNFLCYCLKKEQLYSQSHLPWLLFVPSRETNLSDVFAHLAKVPLAQDRLQPQVGPIELPGAAGEQAGDLRMVKLKILQNL